jgi:hypothetical protein
LSSFRKILLDSDKENKTVNSFPPLLLPNLKQFIEECCDADGNFDANKVQRVANAHSARERDAILDDLVTFIVKTAGQPVNTMTRILREKVGIPQMPASQGLLLELLACLLLQRQKVSRRTKRKKESCTEDVVRG